MSFAWAILVVGVFAAVLEILDLPTRAMEVGRRCRECLALLRDSTLTDEQKEKALQRETGPLFTLSCALAGGCVLAAALPLAALWGLDLVGWASLPAVWATLQRLDFLAAVSVAGGLAWLVLRRHV